MDHQVVDRNPFITSLRSSALRVCVLHANNYVSLGDLPYVLVQPILEACTPNRLALLEDQSPHLRADTQDLWKHHISQKFHVQVETREDEDWRDVYERLKLEESARLESATARLRAKNGKLKEEKMAKRIVVIDPKKTAVIGDRKRSHRFGSMSTVRTKRLKAVAYKSTKEGKFVDGEGEEEHFYDKDELCERSALLNSSSKWIESVWRGSSWTTEDTKGAGISKRQYCFWTSSYRESESTFSLKSCG